MRRLEELYQLAFLCIAVIAVAGLAMPLAATARAATPAAAGEFYVWSYYKADATGCRGTVYVTDPTLVTNSACANFVAMLFGGDATRGFVEFMAVGWLEGKVVFGDTGTKQMSYWDQLVRGVYSGKILSSAALHTWLSFRVNYVLGTVNNYAVYVSDVEQKRTGFSFSAGRPTAQAESHDNLNTMRGEVKDLQYMLHARKIIRWYAWDGYGPYAGYPGTGADPPYRISVLSNTQWTYETRR